jgi:FkbM family methyltransferase
MTGFRRRLAAVLCRPLPPLISQRVRSAIYPLTRAITDAQQVTVTALTGSTFHTSTNDFHGYVFSVHGFYEWRNWAIALALCGPEDTIIEIGANIGTETIGFSDLVPRGRVVAFEPLPSNLDKLKRALAEIRHDNVEIRAEAVSSSVGTVRFAIPEDAMMSGVGHIADGASSARSIEVRTVTLDAIASELGAARLICIDAEGAETAILDGARGYLADHGPALVLEASPPLLERAGRTLAELHASIAGAGYQIFEIGRLDLRPLHEVPAGRKPRNWLCLAGPDRERADDVRRSIVRCGLVPSLPMLHPLRTRR